jgi:hypothetical protein
MSLYIKPQRLLTAIVFLSKAINSTCIGKHPCKSIRAVTALWKDSLIMDFTMWHSYLAPLQESFYLSLHPSQHSHCYFVDCVWNVMAHAQKPDFIFRRNRQVHLNQWGRQFIRLLAAELCASAVVMLDTPCSEAVWRLLSTHSIYQFPLHFPSHVSLCAITFQLDSNNNCIFSHVDYSLSNQ